MAIQVRNWNVTVPAGTADTAPQITPLPMPVLAVQWVEFKIPPGANGTVGFCLASSGQQVIPFAPPSPSWIVGDNDDLHWDLEDLPTSGDWALVSYNAGVWPHTVTVRFGLALPTPAVPAVAAVPMIPAGVLSTAPTAG